MHSACTNAHDKENIPIIVPRVNWTQANQQHSYTLIVRERPPAKSANKQTKSILKKRAVHTTDNNPKDLERQVSQPMESVTFFKSPLETIAASVAPQESKHISLHDLAEAYNVLANRICSQANLITHTENPSLAFEGLRPRIEQIVTALRRDVTRTLSDSFSTSPRKSSNFDETLSTQSCAMTHDEIKYTRDEFSACQASLRVLSNLLRLTCLHSIFSVFHLQELFDTLLSILLSTAPRSPYCQRTYIAAIWVLQHQRLPQHVLAPRAEDITTVIQRAITVESGRECEQQILSDGLKAVHELVVFQPSLFLPNFSNLLPKVLVHLTSPIPVLRTQAAHALGGLSLAVLDFEAPPQLRDSISSHIGAYIDFQYSRRHKPTSPTDSPHLTSLLDAATKSSTQSETGQGLPWAISVLASFIILSGPAFFSRPRALKLVIPTLAQAFRCKSGCAKSLHSFAWKCLVYALVQLRSGLSFDEHGALSLADIAGRAFLVVKQELREGIGVAVVGSLLSSTSSPDVINDGVAKALEVLKDMINDKRMSTRNDARALLNRLLCGATTSLSFDAGTSQTLWNHRDLPIRLLFDGTILFISPEKLSNTLKPEIHLGVDHVRALSKTEIVQNWDLLLSIWEIAFRDVSDRAELSNLPEDISQIWRHLLVACRSHQPCESLIPSNLHRILSSIFTNALKAPHAMAEDNSVYVHQLSYVRRLWQETMAVFPISWCNALSGDILLAILRSNYDLNNAEMMSEWAATCMEVVRASLSVASQILCNTTSAPVQLVKEIWAIVGKSFGLSDGIPWDSFVSFLIIPLDSWVLSDREMVIWNDVLNSAVAHAGASHVRPIKVVNSLVARLKAMELKKISSYSSVVDSLLNHVTLVEGEQFPHGVFSIVNDLLSGSYPPNPTSFAPLLKLLRSFSKLVKVAPPSHLVQLLSTVQHGLCNWIRDEKEVFLESEYNDFIMSLYCDSLVSLELLPPSLEVIHLLAPFLESAFNRIPHPALGPIAFMEFWTKTLHRSGVQINACPESLQPCVKAVFATYGGDFLDMSLDSETQMTPLHFLPLSPAILSQMHLNSPKRSRQGQHQSSMPILSPKLLDNYQSSSPVVCEGLHVSSPEVRGVLTSLNVNSIMSPSDSLSVGAVRPSRTSDDNPFVARTPEFGFGQKLLPDSNASEVPETPEFPRAGLAPSSPSLQRVKNTSGRDIVPSCSPLSLSSVPLAVVDKPAKRHRESGRDSANVGLSPKRRKISGSVYETQALHLPKHYSKSTISPPEPRSSGSGSTSVGSTANLTPGHGRRASQSSRRLVMDCVEVPTYAEVRRRSERVSELIKWANESQSITSKSGAPGTPMRRTVLRPRESAVDVGMDVDAEDYDEWEVGLRTPDVQRVRDELVVEQLEPDPVGDRNCDLVPDSDDGNRGDCMTSTSRIYKCSEEEGEFRASGSGSGTTPAGILLSLPLRAQPPTALPFPHPPRLHPQAQVQREPRHGKTTTALQDAYAAILADDAEETSQLDVDADVEVEVEDLMRASGIVHRIGVALSEKMGRRLRMRMKMGMKIGMVMGGSVRDGDGGGGGGDGGGREAVGQ